MKDVFSKFPLMLSGVVQGEICPSMHVYDSKQLCFVLEASEVFQLSYHSTKYGMFLGIIPFLLPLFCKDVQIR